MTKCSVKNNINFTFSKVSLSDGEIKTRYLVASSSSADLRDYFLCSLISTVVLQFVFIRFYVFDWHTFNTDLHVVFFYFLIAFLASDWVKLTKHAMSVFDLKKNNMYMTFTFQDSYSVRKSNLILDTDWQPGFHPKYHVFHT